MNNLEITDLVKIKNSTFEGQIGEVVGLLTRGAFVRLKNDKQYYFDFYDLERYQIEYCQPKYNGEIQTRLYAIIFEDAEMGILFYHNEEDAREAFEKLTTNWNCYLLAAMERRQ